MKLPCSCALSLLHSPLHSPCTRACVCARARVLSRASAGVEILQEAGLPEAGNSDNSSEMTHN